MVIKDFFENLYSHADESVRTIEQAFVKMDALEVSCFAMTVFVLYADCVLIFPNHLGGTDRPERLRAISSWMWAFA